MFSKILKYWTFWSMVSGTLLDQFHQRIAHPLQHGDLFSELVQLLTGKLFDIGTRARVIFIHRQKGSAIFYGKIKCPLCGQETLTCEVPLC